MKLLFIILLVFSSMPAMAYLDPGTGSYLIQFLLAGIFGFIFYMKLYWAKIKSYFHKSETPINESEESKIKRTGSQ